MCGAFKQEATDCFAVVRVLSMTASNLPSVKFVRERGFVHRRDDVRCGNQVALGRIAS